MCHCWIRGCAGRASVCGRCRSSRELRPSSSGGFWGVDIRSEIQLLPQGEFYDVQDDDDGVGNGNSDDDGDCDSDDGDGDDNNIVKEYDVNGFVVSIMPLLRIIIHQMQTTNLDYMHIKHNNHADF